MRSSELRAIEEARAADRPAPKRRIVQRDGRAENVPSLRRQVEAELRASGVRKIFREERDSWAR